MDAWGVILTDSAPYCRRIKGPIPIEFRLHKDESRMVTKKGSGKTKLKIYDFFAALHRRTWQRRFDEGHDYYLYIEHDISFGPEQFISLLREFEHLNGTRYMPGLLR